MALITFPGYDRFKSFQWTSLDIVGESSSPFTGSAEYQEHPGKLWTGQFTWRFYTEEEARAYDVFLRSLRGKVNTFLLRHPLATTRGVATGTPVINGTGQTGMSLATSGWTPSTTNILRAGDYISFDQVSITRLYQVIEDVDSDASGEATLSIWPNLRVATVDATAITTTDAVGTFRLANNGPRSAVTPPFQYDWTVEFREAI